MSPITQRVNVTQVEAALLAQANISNSSGNLPSDKSPSTSGTLMVEKDAVASIHAVGFTVIDRYPVRVQLGDPIRRTWVEGCCLGLRGLHDFAIEFGSGSLIEADVTLKSASTDGVEETKRAEAVDVALGT